MTRSVRIHEFGGPDVLRIEDVTIANPAAGEVRLRIHAIGLNRTELTLRSGRSPVKPALPSGIGFEAAGVIDALGPDVTGFAPGDRVALVPAYGAAQYPLYGEMSIAPARSLIRIPDQLDFVDAAAVWSAFGTAWSGLVAVGRLQEGQVVLISAASSSVGLAAIQVANRLGARPIALTRSAAKADALRRFGASAVVVSESQDVATEVGRLTNGRGAELVFDPVGGPGFAQLAKATANGGTMVLYGALATDATVIVPFDIFARDVTVRGVALTVRMRDDVQLAAMKRFVGEGIADGSLRPVIARTFRFDEIADAHRFIEAGEQIGKVVVTL
ncbi:zinc-dependent alcohol dehydrogenase family protein [Caballeronia sp. LjRoot34]|uniref:zinc-dependent alcohol dehydrogenase family protein n=1 Tax=Caballeronia sp. LjRoot34 TaxID=3342325 RepID=UPI003ED0F1DE